MAEIFLARGEGVAGVERYCVLKRILRDRASDVHFVRMFLDEARLAAQLQHANIAQVYDIGKLGDSYFFTMEYVHGETVRALLHRAQGLRRKLPINCVLTIAAGTAAGLHHAHARLGFDGRPLGIVHRDVSPSNLMVSYEGGVKVVDFGVAKAEDRAQETKSGTVKGKISYLSPEQCRGRRVDRRSDLFSLGICFWEMLTTERLFKRASDFENMNAIVTEETPPPSSRRSDVPPEVDALVLRLLSKSPDDRFQTADELVDAIERVASGTSSVLSASALGRFVRELFGQRPEPWLELESQHESGEAVTVTSEPIPRELAIPVADEVNHQLASVVDLSSPPSITESLESVPYETAKVDKRASLGFPLAAPPPTQPRIIPATTSTPPTSPLPQHARTMVASYSTSPPPGLSSSELPAVTAVVPSGQHPAQVGPRSASFAMPSGAQALQPGPHALPSGQYVTQAGPHALPSGQYAAQVGSHALPSGQYAAQEGSQLPQSGQHLAQSGQHPAQSGQHPAQSGQHPAQSGQHAASFGSPSGSQGALRISGAYGTPGRRRSVWPLYAVIGSAALLGSIAVVLMMRSSSGAMVVDGASATRAVEPTVTPRDPTPVAAAAGIAVSPVAEPAAPGAVAIADPEANHEAAPVVQVAVAVPQASGSDRAPVRPPLQPASSPGATSPPLRSAQPSGMAAPSPRNAPPAVAAPSRSAEPAPATLAPGSRPGKREPQEDEIVRSYHETHYDKVVTLCSAGPVSAEHAPMCFLAACHVGNDAKARKLITAVPSARRDQLITNCKQLGVDITTERKKPDKSAEECETDPMACQH